MRQRHRLTQGVRTLQVLTLACRSPPLRREGGSALARPRCLDDHDGCTDLAALNGAWSTGDHAETRPRARPPAQLHRPVPPEDRPRGRRLQPRPGQIGALLRRAGCTGHTSPSGAACATERPPRPSPSRSGGPQGKHPLEVNLDYHNVATLPRSRKPPGTRLPDGLHSCHAAHKRPVTPLGRHVHRGICAGWIRCRRTQARGGRPNRVTLEAPVGAHPAGCATRYHLAHCARTLPPMTELDAAECGR